MNSKYYRALMEREDPLHPSQVIWSRELKRCLERERGARRLQEETDRPYLLRNCITCEETPAEPQLAEVEQTPEEPQDD